MEILEDTEHHHRGNREEDPEKAVSIYPFSQLRSFE